MDEQIVELPAPSSWPERIEKLTVFFQYHAALLAVYTGQRPSQQPPLLSCSINMSELGLSALDT